MRKIDIAALGFCIAVIIGFVAFMADDIIGTRNLIWFDQAEEECFEDLSHPDVPAVQAMHMLAWRLLDNFPAICNTLSPPPDLGECVPLTVIAKQDYYYRCWHNVTIVVDVPTAPKPPVKITRDQLPL